MGKCFLQKNIHENYKKLMNYDNNGTDFVYSWANVEKEANEIKKKYGAGI